MADVTAPAAKRQTPAQWLVSVAEIISFLTVSYLLPGDVIRHWDTARCGYGVQTADLSTKRRCGRAWHRRIGRSNVKKS